MTNFKRDDLQLSIVNKTDLELRVVKIQKPHFYNQKIWSLILYLPMIETNIYSFSYIVNVSTVYSELWFLVRCGNNVLLVCFCLRSICSHNNTENKFFCSLIRSCEVKELCDDQDYDLWNRELSR